METVVEVLGLVAPAIIAALSVVLMNGLKSVVGVIDNAPALVKRVTVILIAYGLAKLSGLVGVALPETLQELTITNLEALMAAALAMAFHAGDKTASSPAARTMLLLLFAAMPVAAACQTGSATVTVVDRSRLRVEVAPRTFTGEIGDTVTFTAVARDTVTNQVIPAVFRWSSQDTLGVRVDPLSGLATLRRAGTYQILAAVQRITAMIIMREQNNGSWREVFSNERQPFYASTGVVPPRLDLSIACTTWNTNGVPNGLGGWTTPPTCRTYGQGEQAHLCAYYETDTSEHYIAPVTWSSENPAIVSVTQGSDLCPTWAPGMPFPSQAMRLPPELYRLDRRVG